MTPILPSSKTSRPRRPYRAPAGLPKGREDWRIGSAVSVLVHLGIILLLFMPVALLTDLRQMPQGAGGSGPAGGGGGGIRRAGAIRAELLRFVSVASEMPAPAKPKVDVPPPLPVVPPTPMPAPSLTPKEEAPTMPVGVGGAAGSDQTAGTGPGSGGGVGSGVGTGRGSATGAGTGGGSQANSPPTPAELYVPPTPIPASVRGSSVIAEFDVDATGKVLSVTFTETRDRSYNRRLAEVLRSYRFKPGVRPDGTPIRMKAQVTITF